MRTILLKKWQGRLTAFLPGGGFGLTGSSPTPAPLGTIALGLCLLLLPVILALAVLATLVGHVQPELASSAPMLFGFAGITAAKRREDLDKIIAEAEGIEKKYEGKPIPEAEGKKLEELYKEGEKLSTEIEEEAKREETKKRMKGASKYLGEIPDPIIPDARKPEEKNGANRVAGYLRLGDLVGHSEKFRKWVESGADGSVKFQVPHLLRIPGASGVHEGFIPLTKDMREAFEKGLEKKDLLVTGTGVIEPDRLTDIVRATERDELRLRDILNVSPTSSNSVEWVRLASYTRAADIQSEGATAATMEEKPEADAEFEIVNSPVRTIAVWIPVTEQQLQDVPALINMIEQELLYDLQKKEEEEIVWGDGTGVSLDGLDANVTDDSGNDDGGDSLLDKIRRRITFVRTRGYQPNGTAIHPEEWEEIELLKGSDGHYIWAIIRDTLGPRVWGTRVVETVAMDEPGGSGRIVIVGDFRMGATLWDRRQPAIAIGWQDKQFIQNLRTIRAEERVAFGVRRPGAFSKIVIA